MCVCVCEIEGAQRKQGISVRQLLLMRLSRSKHLKAFKNVITLHIFNIPASINISFTDITGQIKSASALFVTEGHLAFQQGNNRT